MQEVEPTPLVASILRDFRDAGGAVDYVLLKPDDPSASLARLHREAAGKGMDVIELRCRTTAQETQRLWGQDITSYVPRIKYDLDRANGEVELTDLFLSQYWRAFSDPPHAMRLPNPDQCFQEINDRLLGELLAWSIWRWSSDWSSYFDAGNEWWGAFLWTLVYYDKSRVIWIGASTTD